MSAPLLHILNTLKGGFHFVLKLGSTGPAYSPLIEEGLVMCFDIRAFDVLHLARGLHGRECACFIEIISRLDLATFHA